MGSVRTSSGDAPGGTQIIGSAWTRRLDQAAQTLTEHSAYLSASGTTLPSPSDHFYQTPCFCSQRFHSFCFHDIFFVLPHRPAGGHYHSVTHSPVPATSRYAGSGRIRNGVRTSSGVGPWAHRPAGAGWNRFHPRCRRSCYQITWFSAASHRALNFDFRPALIPRCAADITTAAGTRLWYLRIICWLCSDSEPAYLSTMTPCYWAFGFHPPLGGNCSTPGLSVTRGLRHLTGRRSSALQPGFGFGANHGGRTAYAYHRYPRLGTLRRHRLRRSDSSFPQLVQWRCFKSPPWAN